MLTFRLASCGLPGERRLRQTSCGDNADSPRRLLRENARMRQTSGRRPFVGAGGIVKNYYRVMLGSKSIHAEECFAGGFIGTDFGINQDLTDRLPEDWRTFNGEFIPIFLKE